MQHETTPLDELLDLTGVDPLLVAQAIAKMGPWVSCTGVGLILAKDSRDAQEVLRLNCAARRECLVRHIAPEPLHVFSDLRLVANELADDATADPDGARRVASAFLRRFAHSAVPFARLCQLFIVLCYRDGPDYLDPEREAVRLARQADELVTIAKSKTRS